MEVVRRGDSVGKRDMNNLCGIRGLVGRGGVLLRMWGMELGRVGGCGSGDGEGEMGKSSGRIF